MGRKTEAGRRKKKAENLFFPGQVKIEKVERPTKQKFPRRQRERRTRGLQTAQEEREVGRKEERDRGRAYCSVLAGLLGKVSFV